MFSERVIIHGKLPTKKVKLGGGGGGKSRNESKIHEKHHTIIKQKTKKKQFFSYLGVNDILDVSGIVQSLDNGENI